MKILVRKTAIQLKVTKIRQKETIEVWNKNIFPAKRSALLISVAFHVYSSKKLPY
jgi:hypothetical protein